MLPPFLVCIYVMMRIGLRLSLGSESVGLGGLGGGLGSGSEQD